MKAINSDKLDFLTVKIIKKLGNNAPKTEQIELLKSLLSITEVTHSLAFNNQLTSSEIACLLLAAKGKTSKATAEIMGVKLTTIETIRRRIINKLNCENLAEAVFKGVQLGCLAQKRTYLIE